MKNPCDICLIKTMCGTVCRNKIDYGKYWQKQKEKIIKRLDSHRTEILTTLLKKHGTFKE